MSNTTPRTPAPRVARYEATPGQVKKALLLFSGGLDSSVMVHWLRENYGCEVVCFTLNLGDPHLDGEEIKAKAIKLGAAEAHCIDVIDRYAEEMLAPAILANADYQGGYHLSCPLGRVMISSEAVRIAKATGCDAIAHGCTGKGNDQVRFDSYIQTLEPGMKIIAPVREWNMGREEEYEYAKQHGIPVRPPRLSDSGASYSHDDNLWGFTAEGGDIEYPDRVPPLDEILRLCTPPQQAPDEAEIVEIDFEDGKPVALNGQSMKLSTLIAQLNKIGGRHGAGFTVLIEDRIVGLKVRGVYENPAAHILIVAHKNLEKLVNTRDLTDMKAMMDRRWGNNVYDARYYDQTMPAINAFIREANVGVTGTVKVRLYKGSALVVAVTSPNALFDANLATFERVEEMGFNTAASAPFIELYSLQNRQAYAIAHHGKRMAPEPAKPSPKFGASEGAG